MASSVKINVEMNNQIDLFSNEVKSPNSDSYINGLTYIPEFIDRDEHDFLLTRIDESLWLNDLKRRVQHYGYKYDYRLHKIDHSMKTLELPSWLSDFAIRMCIKGVFNKIPDQVIVNEYLPGQGISNHIDCTPCFSDTIASLSLGSECIMHLTNANDSTLKYPYLLEKRSLIILKEDSRYSWMHGIKPVKNESYLDRKIIRERRVSLTFRKVILQ
jgi:alkylated DNA repair dioxygenase AlkB